MYCQADGCYEWVKADVVFCSIHEDTKTDKKMEALLVNPLNLPFSAGENPKDALGSKKPRLSLVPPASIIYEALAMQNGADKYGPYNWRDKKVQALIYTEAAMRHILSWQDGEENATDSGVHHLAHAKACLGILLDALETGCLVDNRPVKGVAAKVISEHTKDVH